jgi:nicotinate-nucleotide pyrophosphorylase (carboxylating)
LNESPRFYKIHEKVISKAVVNALNEDRAVNDITTSLLFDGNARDKIITARLLCKEDCILAGSEIFKKVFKSLYSRTVFKTYYKDGDRVRNKSVVLEVKAPLRILLEGERTALNFLQKMSGIAALTGIFVKKLKYKEAKILHTRKTTPNFRIFELAAVKTGGGDFHRFDLNSAVLIKDNHIISAGSVEKALDIVRKKRPGKKLSQRFEIEVKNIKELKQVIKIEKGIVKIVMLDNFNRRQIRYAVKILKKYRIKTELSGGINLKNFDKLQQKGIDYYSIGMLTHSYKSADFSLEL